MTAMKLKIVVTVATALSATSAHAEHWFWDGQKLYEVCQNFRQRSESDLHFGECLGYVTGAIDALVDRQPTPAETKYLHEPRFCLPKEIRGFTLVDIVKQYLTNHPEKRHLTASYLITSALLESYPCPEGDGK
jgi:hypothetical protein